MGAGASVDFQALPNEINYSACKEMTGSQFDEGLFQSVAQNGSISKDKFSQILSLRTDCFLTHDWGKDLGMDNHARVGLLNAALQKRGLKTWFDQEQMQGNIKKQMISGIDNAQCVVVFITKRYTEKVGGDNAEDNCQLEFNYAALRKSATRMVSVVMEERMRNTRTWGGEVAMLLGGRLYVDMCGDLNDSHYLNEKADELYNSIMAVIGRKVGDFQVSRDHNADAASVVAVTGGASNRGTSKPLAQLTAAEVGCLLVALKLGAFKQALVDAEIDGETLVQCATAEELKELGVTVMAQAKKLLSKLTELQVSGVPLELLQQGAEGATTAVANTAAAASISQAPATVPAVASTPAPAAAPASVSSAPSIKIMLRVSDDSPGHIVRRHKELDSLQVAVLIPSKTYEFCCVRDGWACLAASEYHTVKKDTLALRENFDSFDADTEGWCEISNMLGLITVESSARVRITMMVPEVMAMLLVDTPSMQATNRQGKIPCGTRITCVAARDGWVKLSPESFSGSGEAWGVSNLEVPYLFLKEIDEY